MRKIGEEYRGEGHIYRKIKLETNPVIYHVTKHRFNNPMITNLLRVSLNTDMFLKTYCSRPERIEGKKKKEKINTGLQP